MATLVEMIKKIEAAQKGLKAENLRIVKESESEILDLNRKDQLFDKGIDRDGDRLGSYTPTTVQIKQQKGQPFDRTTLFDTGDFYNSFKLKIQGFGDKLNIFATDVKTRPLVIKYGAIFGLTKENQYKLDKEIIKPKLDKWLKAKLK